MRLDADKVRFLDISLVSCFRVCRECLDGRKVEELTIGTIGSKACIRCGRETSDMAVLKTVCPECKLPPSDRPDPGCRTCSVREVMES